MSANDNKNLMAFGHAMAGAVGGVYALTATYPLFTVATRMQVQKTQKYKSMTHALKTIVEEEGLGGLFSGVHSAWVGVFVSQGVFYYAYEFLKSVWTAKFDRKHLDTSEHLFLAALAGCATAIASNPVWVVNTHMTSAKGAKKTMAEAAKEIYTEQGPSGFWNGLAPALFMVINPTIQHATYERLKIMLMVTLANAGKPIKPHEMTSAQIFWLGAIAKAFATVVAYPGHTVKVRLFAHKKSKDDAPTQKPTISGVINDVYKEHGVQGFYAGMNSKIIQSVLTAALLFVAKEKLTYYTLNAVKMLIKE